MKIERLRYMTEPLAENTLVVGPISLTLYAEIDQEDTNWIVVLKDVGPDVSVRTQREGERFVPDDLPERELTRAWLKASHRAVDSILSDPSHGRLGIHSLETPSCQSCQAKLMNIAARFSRQPTCSRLAIGSAWISPASTWPPERGAQQC
jgi:predicted acyl esterase